MIWRVRDRATFEALRRTDRRVRRGPVTVSFVPDGRETPDSRSDTLVVPSPPRVAFAVGRRAGNAVTRNRIRRRLRAVVRDLATQPDSPVRSGAYLIGAGARVAALPYQELRAIVEAALRQVGHDVRPAR